MSFMVGGGGGVDAAHAGSYSAILKQLNSQEVALLKWLHPRLVEQYERPGGSLLAHVIGRLRYTSLGGERFDAMLMDNVARPPPGADVLPSWRPFDMKGIRLYPHEQRLANEFGSRGLLLADGQLSSLRAAVESDVTFLASHALVDYSYLLTVHGANAPPVPCARAAAEASVGSSHRAGTVARVAGLRGPRLFAAFVRHPAQSGAAADEGGGGVADARSEGDDGGVRAGGGDDGGDGEDGGGTGSVGHGGSGGGGEMCTAVLVRLAVIDYLREWRLTERVEHMQKTLQRDLLAGERNHAVVPVRQFAGKFSRFFDSGLFHSLPSAAGSTWPFVSWGALATPAAWEELHRRLIRETPRVLLSLQQRVVDKAASRDEATQRTHVTGPTPAKAQL